MAVIQISRIQIRTGDARDLPDNLAEGEFGMAKDTGEVFIGAPSFGPVQGRAPSLGSPGVYPYRNIKLLTEFDMQHGITGDVYYHGPLLNKPLDEANLDSVAASTVLNIWPGWPVTAEAIILGRYAIYDYSITEVPSGVSTGVEFTVGTLMIAADGMSIPKLKDTRVTATDNLGITFGIRVNTGTGDYELFIHNSSGKKYVLHISGRTWTAPVSSD